MMCRLDELKQYIKWIGKKIIIYIVSLGFNYIIFRLLHVLGVLKVFHMDIFPYISMKSLPWIMLVLIALLIYWSGKGTDKWGAYIAVKHYAAIIRYSIFAIEIVIWEKCENSVIMLMILFSELCVLYILLEDRITKLYPYQYADYGGKLSNKAEVPVVGIDLLTGSQRKAYNKVLKALDDTKSTDNINIALVGAWGTGKSSIMETMINELQKRTVSGEKYFILKICMQTLNGTSNIMEYVEEYFACLFERYGVIRLEGTNNLAFLSNVSKFLSNKTNLPSFFLETGYLYFRI